MEPWIGLFPAIYLIHLLEESFAGERFFNWTQHIVGRRIPIAAFVILNACFFGLMISAVLTLQAGRSPWLLPTLGTITAINGLGHLAGTVATRSYSPGLVTGALLWAPLGFCALVLSIPALGGPTWWFGIGAGLTMSVLVVLLALGASRGASN